MEKEERGKEIEDIVDEICSIAFLEDFVVRNPIFKKESGSTKEAADFLVPFNKTLLAFQVKSKTELKLASEKTRVDFERIENTVSKGVKQLKTISRAVSANQIKELKNNRNIIIPFNTLGIENLMGIVILELIGEEAFPKEEKTALYGGYTHQHGMPIHIFRLQEYNTIISETDTLPDFIDYLITRQKFFEKNIMSALTDELDFLALYKVNQPLIQQCLDGECDFLVIDEGIWDSYQKEHKDRIKKRDILNRPSLVIDTIIGYLHTSLDYDPKVNIPGNRNDIDQGTIDNYFASVSELSTLNRLARRVIGTKFLERMNKADKTGHGHSLIVNQENNSAILVLSTNRSRQQRTNGLFNLCSIAYCALGLSKIIGIVSEPLSVDKRSYDVIFLQDVNFENCEDIKKGFEDCFGPMSSYYYDEYGDSENKT